MLDDKASNDVDQPPPSYTRRPKHVDIDYDY